MGFVADDLFLERADDGGEPGLLERMIANLIDYYVHDLVDFNAAAALSLLILAAIAGLIVALRRYHGLPGMPAEGPDHA